MENSISRFYFVARKGFTVRKIAGENVLVPVNTDNVQFKHDRLPVFNGVVQLNDLALLLWNSIQTPKLISELIEIVCSNYDVNGINLATIEKDIMDFLNIGIYNQIIFLKESI